MLNNRKNNIYQTESLQIIDALQARIQVLNQLLALEIKDIAAF